ncbi:MAG: reverse transcriptase-like protein [Candidatus Saccharimonadales bacterium]
MKQIKITYTNYRNETAERLIEPIKLWYGVSEWHSGSGEQWFLKARDVSKDAERDFAVLDIAGFMPAGPSAPDAVDDVRSVRKSAALPKAKLYTDGGSRGNPGPSALGYVILDMEDNVVKKDSGYLGVTTNNQAEYQALKAGLEASIKLGVQELEVYMDSTLVVNQVQGLWKMKNQELMPHHAAITALIPKFERITFTYVPRALNKLADAMVNECLDAQ